MSDITPAPTTEQSPSRTFRKSDGKRLSWHAFILAGSMVLSGLIDIFLKFATDGGVNLGVYHIPVMAALALVGQAVRLYFIGPVQPGPDESQP